MIDQKRRSKPMTLLSLASKKQQSSISSSLRQFNDDEDEEISYSVGEESMTTQQILQQQP
jgi:hypothetical protein